MKNNKGMTLVEIIISIALISIVLMFLFSLLINVKDINEESEVNSSYLIMKALIIKNIEEDLDKKSDANQLTIKPCESTEGDKIKQIYSSWNVDELSDEHKHWLCINLSYKENTEDGEKNHLIGIYYYEPKESYVISYISDTKTTRLLNDFNINIQKKGLNDTNSNHDKKLNVYFKMKDNFLNINIPLIGSDNKDYSLNIPYYGNIDSNTNLNSNVYINNP